MSASQATHQDAELILKLYDLRREPVMREARNVVLGFWPKSVDEILTITNAFGSKENAYLRQVYGYWEMAAALVVHGTLNVLLVFDTCQEMYFQYAKIQPYVADFRKKMNLPEWMISIERLIERSKTGRKRLATMQKNLAAMATERPRR